MKSEVRQGRSHRSRIPRGVGCEGQEKTCAVVCGPLPQDGQRSLGALPTLSRKLLRDEQ